MKKYLWALPAVLCIMGCATTSNHYRVPKDQFYKKAATIAVLPIEPKIASDANKTKSFFWPVDAGFLLENDVGFIQFARKLTVQAFDSFAIDAQNEITSRLLSQGFTVITPDDNKRLLLEIYRKNGIVTNKDTIELRNDPQKAKKVKDEWLQSIPCEIKIHTTLLYTWARLSNPSPTYGASVYGDWDGTREVFYQGPGMMAMGEIPALSIGMVAVNKEDSLLWWGKGGLSLIKDRFTLQDIFEPQRVKNAIKIALQSLAK